MQTTGEPPSTPPITLRWRGVCALALMMGVVLCLRAPAMLVEGRVWGEEGMFLQAGLERGIWEGMTWRSSVGYYHLQLNVAGVVAASLPLAWAGWVMAGLGAGLMVLPVVVMRTDAVWARRLPWVAVLVLGMGPSAEVWLNVASGQFVIALTTIALLITRATTRAGQVARVVGLALAGLSGVASVVLAPLFVVRAVVEWSRGRAVEAGVMVACLVVQAVLIMQSPGDTRRYALDDASQAGAVVVSRQVLQLLVYPFDVLTGTDRASVAAFVRQMSDEPAGRVLLALGAAAVYAGIVLWAWRVRATSAGWCVGGAAVLVGVSMLASLDSTSTLIEPDAGQRYFYAPNVLLMLAVLDCVLGTRRNAARRIGARRVGWVLVSWVLIGGLLDYLRPEPTFFTPADWTSRVRDWQNDPTLPIPHAPLGWQVIVPHEK